MCVTRAYSCAEGAWCGRVAVDHEDGDQTRRTCRAPGPGGRPEARLFDVLRTKIPKTIVLKLSYPAYGGASDSEGKEARVSASTLIRPEMAALVDRPYGRTVSYPIAASDI